MGLPVILLFGNFNIVSFTIDFIGFFALYIAISLALNIQFGYAGIPNFGLVLFIAGGAAFAGSIGGRLAAYLLSVNIRGDYIVFNPQIVPQINQKLLGDPLFAVGLFFFSVVIGAGIGALFGYASSYPAIRLREDYLGMLLLGAAQFFQVVMRSYDPLTGGAQNIEVPDPLVYFTTLGIGVRLLAMAVILSIFAILVYFYAERVGKSPLGRTLKAVRESEDAARALGKDDAKVRRNALIVGSAIAGMAGVLFTFQILSVEYDTWTRFAWTFWPFVIVIIGGVGNNKGVVVGAFFFSFLLKGLEQIQPVIQPYLFFDPNWLQDLLFAGLLIAILMLRPEGIIREKSTPTLPRDRLRGIVGPPTAQESGGRFSWLTRRIRRTPKTEVADKPGEA